MKVFTKGCLTGTLQLETIDHCVKQGSKIVWKTRQVLMLKDSNGCQLSSAQFRCNAFKQASLFFIEQGWSITE